MNPSGGEVTFAFAPILTNPYLYCNDDSVHHKKHEPDGFKLYITSSARVVPRNGNLQEAQENIN